MILKPVSSSEVSDERAKLEFQEKLESSNFCTDPSAGEPDVSIK